MYFTKTPHPANFRFASRFDADACNLTLGRRKLDVKLEAFEGDIYHLQISHPGLWTENLNLVQLERPAPLSAAAKVTVGPDFSISLTGVNGRKLLESVPAEAFGVMGEAFLFSFQNTKGAKYYGLGEKTFGRLEVGGVRTKFWNVDAWADFHWAQWGEHPSDPYYAGVPYVIVRVGKEYVGLLLETPHAPFIETGAGTTIPTEYEEPRNLLIGAEGGLPSLWILYGPTLRQLTRKLAKLVGTTPLPPVWALGYHQSRWGYAGQQDLLALDEKFTEHGIPCDALWLDIDYMDGYRVFTYRNDVFPEGVPALTAEMSKRGRKVVPIIDPGVKREAGYSVYEDGKRRRMFCQNVEGQEFVGMVWPGRTVFPDFSLEAVRSWWSSYAESFSKLGFAGAWLDMNDPSTGAVDPMPMLFRNGSQPHEAFHNQYALGMQMATREGFLRARPKQRPFLLSRSGWIGTSRYAALWTGDNVSNRFYLRSSIPTTLNLALSGIPFNGPDVGGFGGDATEALMVDWIKCCFLFPFFRNHSVMGCREQEPWRFGKAALGAIRHYIRLRYRLMPYLVNLFMDQEELGDPAIRPLLYHFEDKASTSDQFLVGDALLQAPLLEENASTRSVFLPGRRSWFDLARGGWVKPGKHTVAWSRFGTPLYARDGAIIPIRAEEPTSPTTQLNQVELHVFLDEERASYDYRADDGETFAYLRGERSAIRATASRSGQDVKLSVETLANGHGPIETTFVIYGPTQSATLNGAPCRLEAVEMTWAGKPIGAKRVIR